MRTEYLAPTGWDAEQLPPVGALGRPVRRHLVALRDHLLDGGAQIGAPAMYAAHFCLAPASPGACPGTPLWSR